MLFISQVQQMKKKNYLGGKQSRFANRGECFMTRLTNIWLLKMPEDSASALMNVGWSLLIISLRFPTVLKEVVLYRLWQSQHSASHNGNIPESLNCTAFDKWGRWAGADFCEAFSGSSTEVPQLFFSYSSIKGGIGSSFYVFFIFWQNNRC